ncbi:MAG: tRNA (adenosine(37)-N6)-threonylcarbamoyltransferase complex dimerization subunit type 1 TsaB [Bacteroidota bacterium]|nr:tRNA (adenosine(37)-N6)-threonylcarbamoyltransferase complex dimerization subunit type 1 TsaB [Bacteroidota bacterium]
MDSMNPIKILHIESATHICSVAVSQDLDILSHKESNEPNSHSKLLTVFIEEALQELQLRIKDLDAISVSVGPGSYTGLRIGVSTAKGLAYGAGIPVLPIDTLKILANRVYKEILPGLSEKGDQSPWLRPMLDARRLEVYTALYDSNLQELDKVRAEIITEESFISELNNQTILFFGNGAEKCETLITHPNARFIKNIESSSVFMTTLALEKFKKKEFADTAYFEPFYLKDFIATLPRNKVIPNQPDRGDFTD